MTTEIYNVEFEYAFTDYMVVDAVFRSDSVLYWTERGSSTGATEDIHTIHLLQASARLGRRDNVRRQQATQTE